jgi:hypothetical protein
MPIKTYHRQGITKIMGLGSAVERSRTGHRMSQDFIDKLKQATNTGKKHLLINHDPNQIAGKVTGTQEGKSDEILPLAELLTPHENPIVDAPRAKVEHWLNNKVELGMSFGGTATKVDVIKEADGRLTYDVQDGELMEWSITPINAVKRSDGTVKAVDDNCPGGICQQIAQQIENGPNLPKIEDVNLNQSTTNLKQSTGSTLNQTAYDYALQCIRDENVDLETPWNRGDYESYNINEHEDLTNSCLGLNVTVRDDYQKYRYRVCIGGKLYKQAVISVASNSPAGSGVYQAADELLKLIYQMEEPGEPAAVTQANMFKCSNCGQFNNPNTLMCVSCGSRLPNNTDGNSPIAKQTNGDDIMGNDNSKPTLEQKVDILLQDLEDRKKAEAEAKLKQEKDAEIQQALQEQEEKHKEEMEAFKQATKEATEELINDTLKQILGDKAGIIQQSRHPENQDPEKSNSTQEQDSPVQIEQGSDKTITEQAAEAMTVEERYKSSVYAPPVVFGKVVEQGWTPDEFLNMAAKRDQG